MDMMMPGMSGIETTEKIRENPKTKNIKVMFLTVVLKSEIALRKLKKLRPIDYIEKPFENTELVNRVKCLLGK
jgi:two-component system phosphate regulon response regulator PhoB